MPAAPFSRPAHPQLKPETHPPEPVNLAEFQIRRKQILGGLTYE